MVYSVPLQESVESEDYESNVKAVDATYINPTQRQSLLQVSTVKKGTQSSGLLAPEGPLHWWHNSGFFFLNPVLFNNNKKKLASQVSVQT